MEKKTVSAILLTLLLTSMLTLTFNIQPVKAEDDLYTIYIRADGSIDPPTAPISTADNVTYTFTDNISDFSYIVIERNDIVIDGAGYTLQAFGGHGIGFYWSGINNVTIKNTTIKDFSCGIVLLSSSNSSISGNNITNNLEGISLNSSSNSSISGNTITNSYSYGIWLLSSSNNTISGNTFTNNGLFVWASYQNSVENNTINGRPLVYLEGASNYTVDDAGQVILVRCDNIRVEGLNLSSPTIGIELWETSNSSISGNTITNSYSYGIWLLSSSNNRFYHNNLIDNTQQVYFGTTGYANVWDDGYPSGGNYWSDYTDVDLYSGPYQNEAGGDGVWDHPYVIDTNNKDRYPLVNPWTPTLADSFCLPLDGLWTVSQRFGRWNPEWQGYHLGEDVLRSFEAPVYAPANGIVRHNAKRTGYGYVVIIEHQLMDGTFVCSVLGHLREAGRVPVGATVTEGQIVGYLSSVPEENGGIIHLHFGIGKGMYSEELDFDGKWRYRGYGPIDIIGSWCPSSAFIEYYNLNKEIPPSYDLTINTEGGGAAASSTSVFTLVYKTVLSLVASQPWWQRWSGTDNDYQNPTTVTMDFHKAVTAWFRSEPPPPCPTPWELAKSLIGADYVWGGQGWNWSQTTQSWVGGKWLDANEIREGYYFYNATTKKVEFCTGLDCSGLVFWAYNKWAYENLSNGSYSESLTISANMIYAYADARYLKTNNGDPISKEELQPGDLLFFDTDDPAHKNPDHVAMYVGNFDYGGKTYNVTHASGATRTVTPALYNPATETLTTEVPGKEPQNLTVNRGYGRVFNHSDRAKPSYTCKSPIDLVVTDPEGVVLTKDVGEVPGMFYVEFDADGNGELDDTVVVWDPKIGDYSITLIPEQGALPTDDFTLEASANGTTILLADYAQISEIPTDPYIITRNETAIMLRNINIATTNVTLSKGVVGQGHSLFINATVQNQGNLAETLNVTLYANTTSIATQTITLTSGGSATITFTWNTTGFAKGNYTIWAYACPVQGETYTADNTLTDGSVVVAMVGDVNGDGYINIKDIVLVSAIFGSQEGSPDYNPNPDINGDGYINIKDIVLVSANFGAADP